MLKIATGLSLDPDYVGGGTLALLSKKGAGKSYTMRVLAEEFWREGVQFVALDPMGAGWGLRSSADGKSEGIPIAIFGGEHGDAPLERTAGKLMADLAVEEGLSMVLDMSELGSRAAERQFGLDFLERLYRQNGKSGRLIHLLIDEADLFAPQKPSAGDQPLLGVTENIVRRGRNRGIGCTRITQRPAVLNKDVLTQIDALVAMRITGYQDREAIDDWVRGHGDQEAAKEVKGTLSGLENGESWWWIPELGILKRVQIRTSETFDSSPTRKRNAKRAVPKSFADVDMEAIQSKMAESIERAKADDPRELRKRIAALDRDLRDAREHETERRVEIEVLVPDKQQVKALDKAISEMSDFLGAFDRTIENADAKIDGARAVRGGMADILNEMRAVVDRVSGRRVEAAPRVPEGGPVRAGTRVAAQGSSSPSAPPRPVLNGDGPKLGKPHHKILDGLATLEAIRVFEAPKSQLALLIGVSPKSGAFFNNLGKLRSADLLDYRTPGTVSLTESGRALADDTNAPRTTEALHEQVRAIVKEARWKIVERLIEVYPEGLSKDALAQSIGVSGSSGAFFNNLGKLRTLGLIDYPSPGHAAATSMLFLD